jgi:hypothetical protein
MHDYAQYMQRNRPDNDPVKPTIATMTPEMKELCAAVGHRIIDMWTRYMRELKR